MTAENTPIRKTSLGITRLKIKVASLAAENRIIRRTEKMCLQHTRWLNVRLQLTGAGEYTPQQVGRIMQRAMGRRLLKSRLLKTRNTYAAAQKPMSDEARHNCIANLKGWESQFDSLHAHRIALRGEARAAHLAYGFLRGVPFKAMEKYSHTKPPIDRAEYHVLKFKPDETDQRIKQRFAEWVEAASDWRRPNYPSPEQQAKNRAEWEDPATMAVTTMPPIIVDDGA